ncbi:apolipoprotein N-acyltransferase [Actinobacillus equuli]|nr:apolipoprotein N-acyltransferase [Actinobacillus equuli]
MPFGEYVPFGSVLDWMRDVFILPINLSQGEFVQQPLFAKKRKFNMAICYEVIFGHQMQQNQQAQQSDYLLTITNDAWFGASIGPWQHFQMARMRALELGKPLLRAANTGITAVIGAKGEIIEQIPQFEANVLTTQIQPLKGETLFAKTGSWLIYALSLFCLILSFANLERNRPLVCRRKHQK